MQIAIRTGVYVFLYIMTAVIAGFLLRATGTYLLAVTLTGLAASIVANALSLRIFEGLHLPDIGLRWNPAAARNFSLGLLGGAASAAVALALPLLFGMARFQGTSNSQAGLGTLVFTASMLLFGSAGEEMLFRGYGFQILLRSLGPFATILPVGIIFGLLHTPNPSSSYLSLANTVGFGILFGCAFLRSFDLWLPLGLHFGWNFTLPLFGVNVSGIKIEVTGYRMTWSAGPLWSGGDYGIEASILTSSVLLLLSVFIWKAPIRRQPSRLLDPVTGGAPCDTGRPQS